MVVQNLAYTALLLGVLVTVHELGHFLVAKALDVKVLRFSIGFGPALFRWRRGETEYWIAALPLGGYVKMAGDMPNEELAPEDAGRGFLAQPPWKRALIVAAGPVFNLVFPVLVYFFVFFGAHEVLSTRVGSVEPGLPAAAAGLQPGDRVVEVDGQKVTTFQDLQEALQNLYDREISLTISRGGRELTMRLTPAKTVDSDPLGSVTRGMIGISSVSPPPVIGVPAGSPAEAAGLRTFDRILSIDGKPIADEGALNAVVDAAQGPMSIAVLRRDDVPLPGAVARAPELVRVQLVRQPGSGYAALGAERPDLYVPRVYPGSAAAKQGIQRGDRLLAINGRPLPGAQVLRNELQALGSQPFQLTWRHGAEERVAQVTQAPLPDVMDELGKASTTPELGIARPVIGAEENLKPDYVTEHLGVGRAIQESLKIVPEMIGKTIVVVARIITGDIPFQNVGGPIMLYEIASKSAEQGVQMFLNMMAIISINLGIMNLLPIPILDGFHLLAAGWEGIRRRPIPVRAREIANWVGLAMLVLLMFFVFKNDLTR